MKILLLGLILISNAQAQIMPSSCPYLIKDKDSYDILQSTQPILSNELQRIKQEMDADSANCLLPPIDEVAKSEQLIHTLANQMVPPKRSFDSLMLAGQQISCTTTSSGFREIVDSYKSFVLENFPSFPANESQMNSYLELSGPDGSKINNVFYDCHRSQDMNSNNKMNDFSQCLDKQLYGRPGVEDRESVVYRIWHVNCGQDLGQKSLALQKLLNQVDADNNKRQTTEDLINASYNQISNTIDTLLKTDPKCRFSSQLANMANSLVTASVGVGQQMGSPWSGLALNLVAKPISSLVNRFAQGDLRNQSKDLKALYEQINDLDKQRNEKFLCSMLSMQKLKCDTINDYKLKNRLACDTPNSSPIDTLDVSSLVDIMNAIKSKDGTSEPLKDANITEANALDYLQDKTIEQMSELNNLFFKPTKGLKLLDGSDEDLSLYNYLFGKDNSQGILDKVDIEKIESVSDKIKLSKEKLGMENLKTSLSSFKSDMDKVISGELSPGVASSVLNNYKEVLSSLIEGASPTNRPKNIPPNQNNQSNDQFIVQEHNQMNSSSNNQNGNAQGSVMSMNNNVGNGSQLPNVIQKQAPTKSVVNIPFVLMKYYEQMSKGSEKSETYNYALREIKAIANTTFEQTKFSSVKGLAVSDRFNNTENYFNFMSSHYSQKEVLEPILNKIEESPRFSGSTLSEKELHFDAKVLPAIRDCLFLYQPVMMSEKVRSDKESRSLAESYRNKCNFMLKCQKDLGFKLGLNPLDNLNTTTNFEQFRPICHIQRNFGFIFSKARGNYINSGNVCSQ